MLDTINLHQPTMRKVTVNTLNSIRSSIAAYAGGPAIARELLQNADDAKASWIEFHFTTEALIVKNSSVFSDRDFNAICEIGSGNKRQEQDKTGTWGTGFLSVYQITDNPEILSAGSHLVLDPRGHEFPVIPCDVTDHTEFRFGWRTTRTEIGRHIEADIWTPERIAKFEQELIPEVYRALIFLRNVEGVKVYRDNILLCEVRREVVQSEHLDGNTTFEKLVFHRSYSQANGQILKKATTWLFYRRELPDGFRDGEGHEIKSRPYALAIEQSAATDKPLPGTLYNFLPTEIDTGFNFHINGDFFPDANRKSILKGDGSAKSEWNANLIEALAQLLMDNLVHLRDLHATSDVSRNAFYNLLPISCNPQNTFLQPFVSALEESIKEVEVVHTTDRIWTRPANVLFVQPQMQDIRPLIEPFMPGIAPKDFPEKIKEFVLGLSTSRSRYLDIKDYLNFLRKTIRDGVALREASPVVNSTPKGARDISRDRLYKIYKFLSSQFEFENFSVSERQLLMFGVPLCLDTDQRLRATGHNAIWRADEKFRQLIPADYKELMLLDAQVQEKFGALFWSILQPAGIRQLLDILKDLATNKGKPLSHAHAMLNSREKLQRIVTYLVDQNVVGNYRAEIEGLPLVIDTNQFLQPVGKSLRLAAPQIRELLKEVANNKSVSLNLVSPEIEKNPAWVNLLTGSGMSRLTCATLPDFLKGYFPSRQPLGDRYKVEWLLKLYRYFSANEGELVQNSAVLRTLRQLPFVLTQGGDLAAIENGTPLALPPAKTNNEIESVAAILRLDYLISETVLTDNGLRNFFRDVLGAKETDPLTYIERYIIPHYAQSGLSDDEKYKLFAFIEGYAKYFRDNEQILGLLRSTPLIRCADGVYRRFGQVYFESDFLDNVFGRAYNMPHSCYNFEKSKRNEKPSGSSRSVSRWHSLFEELGVQHDPTAADLVASVEKTVRTHRPSDEKARDHIRTIFNLLVRDFDIYKVDNALNHLRLIAWLPAEDDNDLWHKPSEVYPASIRELVKSQVKILPFGQTSKEFSAFFGLNVEARLEDVVAHLIWLSDHNQPLDENYRIYTYLNDYADRAEISLLQNKPVMYDRQNNRYWLPRHTFTENGYAEFGSYRLYITGFPSNVFNLLKALRVRSRADKPEDYVELLEQIADKYFRPNAPENVVQDDRYLLNRAYEQLAGVLERVADYEPAWLTRLKNLPVVLTKQHQLVRPVVVFFDDRQELQEYFSRDELHLAEYANSKAYPFLAALGVHSFSQSVQRELVRVIGETPDTAYGIQLRRLLPYFEEIKKHYENSKGGFSHGWRSCSPLENVEVVRVNRLEVQYSLAIGAFTIKGRLVEEDSFLNYAVNKLYLQQNPNGNEAVKQLAREIVRLLNPEILPSVIIGVINSLLHLKITDSRFKENAEQILNNNDITRDSATGEEFKIDEQKAKEAEASLLTPKSASSDISSEKVEPKAQAEPLLPPRYEQSPLKVAEIVNPLYETDLEVATPVATPSATSADRMKPSGETAQPTGYDSIWDYAEAQEEKPATQKPDSIPQPNFTLNAVETRREQKTQAENGQRDQRAEKDKDKKKEQYAVEIPPFIGQVRPRVPYIPTNYADLRKRYGHLANGKFNNFAETDEQIKNDLKDTLDWDDDNENTDEYVNQVRFVLSFQMRQEGFLPLTKQVKTLLDDRHLLVTCVTDDGITFSLYLDATKGIAYNQEALPGFFANNMLPAGAIIYLERQHGDTFRLFYKAQPHIVKNVRYATLNENNEFLYDIIEEMEVPCETAEWVFRADKRLEDDKALFVEAFGKKSVFDTIIAIFESYKDAVVLHENNIFHQVFNIRMVSRLAIKVELQRRPCFVNQGDGNWSFQPGLLWNANPSLKPSTSANAVNGNSKSSVGGTSRTTESTAKNGGSNPASDGNSSRATKPAQPSVLTDGNLRALVQQLQGLPPVQLTEKLAELREDFNYFVVEMEKLFRSVAPKADNNLQATLQVVLAELQEKPNDRDAATNLQKSVGQLLKQVVRGDSPMASQELKVVLEQIQVAQQMRLVQPLLEKTIAGLSADGKFDTAIMLLEFGGRSTQPLFDIIRNRQQARQLFGDCDGRLSLDEELERLVEIIRLDSQHKEARRRLDGQILAYIDRDLKQVEGATRNGKMLEAVEAFSRLWQIQTNYGRYMDNADNLKIYVQRTRATLADLLNRHGADLTIGNKLAKLRYLDLVGGAHKKIIELLQPIAQFYIDQNMLPEATLALGQIEHLLEPTQAADSDLVLQNRRKLRECYDKLELWKHSHSLSESISKICLPTQVAAERQKANNAAVMIRQDQTRFYARHREYLQSLQLCKSEAKFYPCFASFLDEVIEKENNIFRYVG